MAALKAESDILKFEKPYKCNLNPGENLALLKITTRSTYIRCMYENVASDTSSTCSLAHSVCV